uniref:Retrovirus-related Pol polyprotein from transposon TNT 1-94-like beta-barrel domain-containing protein n=1 Tax=Tanacetum cinerariifolium TaxID=118510 RepID=A0A6L2JQ54_TANCI|nr:hypothetical protein [Tanacetum cinerariifolium]
MQDRGIAEGPVTQTIITHNAACQANDLDAYDSDCDDFSTTKADLMADLSSYRSNVLSEIRPMLYDGNVIAKETNVISIVDSKETLMLEEENFGKRFVQQRELSDEQALHPHTDQSPSLLVKIKAPRELLKAKNIYSLGSTSEGDENTTNPPTNPPTHQALHTLSTIKLPILKKEGLHKGYDRFQSLLSQLETHGAGVSTEDANQKFLSGPQLDHEDLEQVDEFDLEEIDLKWHDFYKTKEVLQKDREKAKERLGNTGYKTRDNGKRPAKQDEQKAMVIDDEEWNYMPYKSDFEIDELKFTYGPKQSTSGESNPKTNDLNSCDSNSSVETLKSIPKLVTNKPKAVSEPKVWSDALIIKEYESDSNNEHVTISSKEQEKPSFAFVNTVKHVKTSRQTIKEQNMCSKNPKPNNRDWNGLMSKRMAKQIKLNKQKGKSIGPRENRPVWNNVQRLNHQNKFVPTTVLTKTGRFTVNAARQNFTSQAALTSIARKVNTTRPKVNEIKPIHNVYKSHSPIRRPFIKTTSSKENFAHHKVKTARDKSVSTIGDNPHQTLKEKGIVDSGCSRHMTGNKAYLVDYQDFNGGPVAFGDSKGQITEKTEGNSKFHETVDFLTSSTIQHALTGKVEPTKPQPTLSPTHPSTGDQPPVTKSSSSHDTTQDSRDSLEGTNGSEGDQVQSHPNSPFSGGRTSDRARGALNLEELFSICTNLSNRVLALETVNDAHAAEIISLKARIKKLEKRCKPSISHHRAWLKSVQRLSIKKRFRKKESVSKQRRKKDKPEPTIDDSTLNDLDANYSIDTEEPINQGRLSEETEELVSTSWPGDSTIRPDVGTADPILPTTTTSILDDKDITMAQTLIKMKEKKSIENGKGVFEEPNPAKKMTRSDLDAAQIAKEAEVARLVYEEELAELEMEKEKRQREKEASKAAIAEMYNEVQAGIKDNALFNMGGYKYSQLKAKTFSEIQDGTEIYMLAERRYPLTKETFKRMLVLRLIAECESDAVFDLLRIIQKQIDESGSHNEKGLHKGYDRFQSLLSQLKTHGVGVSTKDANQKFLRSLPYSWSQVSLIMRTKSRVDTLNFDDLYNNLRVFKSDVKGSIRSSSSTQNLAFVSFDNPSSTNEVNTAYGVSTSSGHNSQKEGSSTYIDDLMYSFFSNQSSGPQLDHEDLE